ncbi:M48 family metallopeptidase [Campylobacter canadensis]|nr:M48 family metallopeptidase [Campylobacter canadensis]MBZ7993969.1 M48 family metallopeptidase [Campylobacter canadensis]MBZ7997662.1 M48 family metallopeptidase [Campylobacter canadensis]MBZ7999301.1 M48 family metallopeptidase [Campylobacter canadensis]MBZ8001098.1 M48 family metallopeptidase [Campylobacter canadensis]MBZ8003627.1 M48 family metallopeptidase [Campylobacter canadensis]
MMLVSLISIAFIFTLFLNLLEIKHIKYKSSKDFLSEVEFKEFKQIALNKLKYNVFNSFITYFINIVFVLFIFKQLASIYDNSTLFNEFAILAIYFLSLMLFTILSNYYETFVLNEKSGFNNKNRAMFFKDSLKSIILSAVFGSIILFILLLCIRLLVQYWYIGAFLVMIIFSIVATIVYPNFIVPIFNKLSLVDGELSEDINALLSRCGFVSKGVYSIDASKNDKRLNAYFAGLFSSKKVVLYDTLIQAMKKRQILAVLGHELGHFKNKDIYSGLIVSFILLFISLYFVSLLEPIISKEIHLESYLSSKILSFVFLMVFFDIFISIITNYLSRKKEFNADKYGAELTSKEDMIEALKILCIKNKALLDHNFLYECINCSHPNLKKRINALTRA